ncbi:MAG: hypothetical protein IKN72_08445 [Clostridia bacterium]|nr:hypothetical protein [Clostridia bacterium]
MTKFDAGILCGFQGKFGQSDGERCARSSGAQFLEVPICDMDQAKWENLSYEEKNRQPFFRQKDRWMHFRNGRPFSKRNFARALAIERNKEEVLKGDWLRCLQ